jgi:hypothetical protein
MIVERERYRHHASLAGVLVDVKELPNVADVVVGFGMHLHFLAIGRDAARDDEITHRAIELLQDGDLVSRRAEVVRLVG